MSIFDSVKTLFGGRKTLADFSMDDLDRERIRLEQSERAFLGDLKKIENKKREWFSKGAEASGREQLIAARKVKELDVEASIGGLRRDVAELLAIGEIGHASSS